MLVLGAMMTAFFTLLWKRLDRIDVRIDRIDNNLDSFKTMHHADMMTLQRDIVGLHDRVAKVEKQ
jgi:hypothetical protein